MLLAALSFPIFLDESSNSFFLLRVNMSFKVSDNIPVRTARSQSSLRSNSYQLRTLLFEEAAKQSAYALRVHTTTKISIA